MQKYKILDAKSGNNFIKANLLLLATNLAIASFSN